MDVTYDHVEAGAEGGTLTKVTGGVTVERIKKTRHAVQARTCPGSDLAIAMGILTKWPIILPWMKWHIPKRDNSKHYASVSNEIRGKQKYVLLFRL